MGSVVGCALVTVAGVAGCSQATTAGRPIRTSAHPSGRRPRSSATTAATLVYSTPQGLAVVGLTPGIGGSVGTKPPSLFLSTRTGHWRNVTPRKAEVGNHGNYGWFEQASFVDRRHGWVTEWNAGTDKITIFRTTDQGRSWTTVPGGFHSANAGAASLIDLLSPTTAFEEQLEPTGPGMTLSATSNAGRSWKTVYRQPTSTPTGHPHPGPFLMPMSFLNAKDGFAASGTPPSEPVASSAFFATSSGGASWRRVRPPMPATSIRCPGHVGTGSPACLYTLPVLTGPTSGTLAAVAVAGGLGHVAFDTTTDAGRHWQRATQLSVPVTSNRAGPGYPLTSTAATSWWALGTSGTSATVDTTTDRGKHWTTHHSRLPAGVPASLHALSPTRALLTVQHSTSRGTSTQLLATTDDGAHWIPLHT